MRETQSGWNEILRITWFLLWRIVLGGIAIGFALGLIVNLVAGYGFGVLLGPQINLRIGMLVALIWWPVVIRMLLKKRFRGFRLALIATDA